jgi:formylglycine-generating enzyme required for sulfatase activity/CheY-like chemotaxis protein
MRILLVDDEAGVLQALAAFFKTVSGHEWRVAANAQKAHEQAAALGGCDLLITDVVMEPTDGFTLRNELQALYPHMRTAFISGYDLSDHTEQIGDSELLPKPVDLDGLRRLIEPPAPVPVPVPQAVPRAANPGFPSAAPRGPQAGIPSAVPRAAGAPQAVARAGAQAPVTAAAPQSGIAAPVAVPRGPGLAPVASGVRAHPGPSSDPLIGVQLGDYRVQKYLGSGHWGSVYLAIQLSVNRPVGLKVLDSERAQEEEVRAHFLADARAKAAVQHPFIVSVFEADERNGLVFYTQEYLDGATLGDLIQHGEQLDEKTALHVMKVAGEGLNYLWTNNLAHGEFGPASIRLGQDGLPRLTNLATAIPDHSVNVQSEIQMLGNLISRLLPPAATSPGLRAFLGRMGGGPNAAASWPIVLQAVKALEPKVIPVEAAKIKAADAAALRAVEAARKAQKRSMVYSILSLLALTGLVAGVIYKFVLSNKRNIAAQVQIPAGSYPVGDPAGEATRAELGAFEIDKYEVTIGEYAEFMRWIKEHPTEEHKFDHPNSNQKHIPFMVPEDDVDKLIRIATNRAGVAFKAEQVNEPGVPTDLNCPMVGVTWWQAYAYAHWKNHWKGESRDLPTEEEWEAAARGPRGFKYPWGDDLKVNYFNSNKDYQPMRPGGFVPDDGYNYWAPVDKFSDDESPFKVIGMAGNVAEWTYRDVQKRQVAVVKGGSFATPPMESFKRMTTVLAEDCWYVRPQKEKPTGNVPPRPGASNFTYVGDEITAATRTLYIGFRTVKRK